METVALLVIGIGWGFMLNLLVRKKRLPTPPDPNNPKCPCGHSFVFHADPGATPACSEKIARNMEDRNENTWVEWQQCPCRRYGGEAPLLVMDWR